MKRRIYLVLAITAILMALAPPAFALTTHSWNNVRGDSLISGGVWSGGRFSYLMLNSAKVHKVNKLVLSANHQPSWVLKNAYKQIKAGNIHKSYITRGTHVGTMSYGKRVVRVMKNTVYRGQYKKLSYYYANSSKTYSITKNGAKYLRTVTYRVSMARACGNVFIFHKKIKDVKLYPLYIEKRQDSTTGTRLSDWQIKGKVGTTNYSRLTSAAERTLVGYFPAGTRYQLSETNKDGWEAVSPKSGNYTGTIGTAALTLTFVNKRTTTPPPPTKYQLFVEKRADSSTGPRLADWHIDGTVAAANYNLITTDNGATLVGTFEAGTSYNLTEVLKEGWEIVSPRGGNFSGTMPDHDVTLTFVNKRTTTPPPPTKYQLFVEKRADSSTGPRLADWHIDGTVAAANYNLITTDNGATLVGTFEAGTSYNLTEVLKEGWEIVSPRGGNFSGTMPDHDVTLTFVNKRTCTPPPPPCYAAFATKGYWHNQNGLAEETSDDIAYINTLSPYSNNPFDGRNSTGNPVPATQGAGSGTWKAEVSAYLIAPNAGGDPRIQLSQQLLAFIFNVRHRLGGSGVTMQLPDGTWATGGSIIASAITAWNHGGAEANAWSTILDTCNNLEGTTQGTGVPYICVTPE